MEKAKAMKLWSIWRERNWCRGLQIPFALFKILFFEFSLGLAATYVPKNAKAMKLWSIKREKNWSLSLSSLLDWVATYVPNFSSSNILDHVNF